jgi:uncharacterized protein with von Willebrand factor type A (vWA) domain
VFLSLLARFASELRLAGLAVGSGDVLAYTTALASLDPADLIDLYWAGRTTLVKRRADIDVYDRVFRTYFLGEDATSPGPWSPRSAGVAPSQSVFAVPATELVAGEPGEQALLGLMASDVEALRDKSFTACTPQELAAIRRIMARLQLTPPKHRTRRTAPAHRGTAPDLRRVVRESMRMHGEPAELYWRRRKVRLRPLILILDVSGSMADYSRNLLQFAYSARRAAARVEVFCFGTRLTRVTKALDQRRPDAALELAARSVFDWDGGTRIGASIDAFVKGWGRRGLCRGGIVVICSDGLDRGDPSVLAAAMERLSRLSHRIVWLNPHWGGVPGSRPPGPAPRGGSGHRGLGGAPRGAERPPGPAPSSLGMIVAAPHVDMLLSGHDLRSLEELAALLPAMT